MIENFSGQSLISLMASGVMMCIPLNADGVSPGRECGSRGAGCPVGTEASGPMPLNMPLAGYTQPRSRPSEPVSR